MTKRSTPFSPPSVLENVSSGQIVEGIGSHKAGYSGEVTSALTEKSAPVAQPVEAALDHPTPFQHVKAFLSRVFDDHPAAHAVKVAPLLTALGPKDALEDVQT